MSDRTGQHLGNYRLLRLLGKGGFAEVYLGEHRHLATQAAIKVLLAHLDSQSDVEGFRREAQTIARLTHPHIVRVLDFDVEQGVPFLVMEYAPFGSLRTRHPRGQPLPLPLILLYVQQVANALQSAHEHRLIHRDVKPDNMLLREDGSVVLSDFGIVTIAHSTSSRGPEATAGTAAYMSPEQMRGEPRPASDQYSLAVTVYEWISGKLPFQGTAMEVAMQHVLKPPPSLVEQVPMLPPFVEQVMLTALAKDPKERFPTVQAFATALELALQRKQDVSTFRKLGNAPKTAISRESTPRASSSSPTEPGTVVAPPTKPRPNRESWTAEQGREQTDASTKPSATQQTRPPAPPKQQYSRRSVLIGLGLAGLALAGGAYFWWAANSHTNPQLPYVYTGHTNGVETVRWSPDGQRLASGSQDRTIQIWNAFTGENAKIYSGHTAAVLGVAWSPDGQRLVSSSADNTLRVWDIATGETLSTLSKHTDIVHDVAWSPDGQRLASASKDMTVQIWDAVSAQPLYTYTAHNAEVVSVVWSPDSQYVASGGYDGVLRVWDATNGNAHLPPFSTSASIIETVSWSPNGNYIALGGQNSQVEVVDMTGTLIYTYTGHSYVVRRVSWSPDGQRIASASFDHTAQVWDALSGNHVYIYRGHTTWLVGIAWSPDGKYIASGSYDKTVQVWSPSS